MGRGAVVLIVLLVLGSAAAFLMLGDGGPVDELALAEADRSPDSLDPEPRTPADAKPTGEEAEAKPTVNADRQEVSGSAGAADSTADGRVVGTVRGTDGQPLAEITVQLHLARQDEGLATRMGESKDLIAEATRPTRTDAEGRFAIESIPAGGTWNVSAVGGDYIEQFERSIVVAGGQTATVELTLQLGGSIAGRVVDAGGRGIQDAQVKAWNSGEVMSGPDGSFILHGLPNRTQRLTARKQGLAQAPPPRPSHQVRAGDAVTGVEIVMHPAREIRGRVLRRDNTPIAGAEISCRFPHRRTRYGMSDVKSEADGSFVLTEIPDTGRYNLEVSAVGYRSTLQEEVEPGDVVEFRLDRSGRVEVIPISEEGGRPVEPKRLVLERLSGWGNENENQTYDDETYDPGKSGVALGGGRYAVPYDTAGKYRIRVEAQGFAPGRSEFMTLDGTEVVGPVTITLDRGGRIRGVLLRALDQTPLPGVSVSLLKPMGRGMAGGANVFGIEVRDDFNREQSTTTGADGGFSFDALQPGRYGLRFQPKKLPALQLDGLEVVKGRRPEPLLVEAPEGGSLTGEVVGRDGKPAVGTPVVAHSANGLYSSNVTDAKGNYRIAVLAPGRYKVEVGDASKNSQSRYSVHMGGQAGDLAPDPGEYTVVIEDGRETRLDFDLRTVGGGTVSGTVLVNGAPVAGLKVQVNLLPDEKGHYANPLSWAFTPETQTDDHGRYAIIGIQPASYRLELYGPSRRPVAGQEVEVRPGGQHIVDLRFDPASINGVVVQQSGTPVPGARVQLTRTTTGDGLYVHEDIRSGADGRFEFSFLPTGDYMVAAQSEGGVSRSEKLTLTGGETRSLRLLLEQAGGILVTLTPEGWKVDEISIHLGLLPPDRTHPVQLKQMDEQGRLYLQGIRPGRYRLHINQYGIERTALGEVEVAAGRDSEISLTFEER